MEQQSAYKKQQKLTFIITMIDLPNFVAITISAIAAHSLIVWLDYIESLGEVLSGFLIVVLSRYLSRDLRYAYNYGVGKVEAMTSLLCESIKISGLSVVVGFSIFELLSPEKPSDLLVYVVILKVINVLMDAIFIREQAKIKRENSTMITQDEYVSYLGRLLFDSATLLSLLCVWLMRNHIVSWYISPLLSIAISIYMFVNCLHHIRHAVREISDKTLPEKEQLKILKVLTAHDDEYSSFGSIKSRYNGESVIVDISVSFPPDTKFEAISRFQNDLQNDLAKEIENCRVSVVID